MTAIPAILYQITWSDNRSTNRYRHRMDFPACCYSWQGITAEDTESYDSHEAGRGAQRGKIKVDPAILFHLCFPVFDMFQTVRVFSVCQCTGHSGHLLSGGARPGNYIFTTDYYGKEEVGNKSTQENHAGET